MYTNNYDFKIITAIKIIVESPEGKVLIIQEPETNKWMPLHWGLPGGNPTQKESLLETFERKQETDLGQKLELVGLASIEEMMIDERTVFMFILVAKANSTDVEGEAKEYKWVDKDELKEMDLTEFTEFFNKQLLIDYLDGKLELYPMNIIRPWFYYDMDDDPDYTDWYNSGAQKINIDKL